MTNAEAIARGLSAALLKNADEPDQFGAMPEPYRSEHGTDAAAFTVTTPLGRFRVSVVEIPE